MMEVKTSSKSVSAGPAMSQDRKMINLTDIHLTRALHDTEDDHNQVQLNTKKKNSGIETSSL
jgi:hypothetical protein